MSRQVEMLRVAYDDASRGNWDTAFDTAARDLEFIPPDLAPGLLALRPNRV